MIKTRNFRLMIVYYLKIQFIHVLLNALLTTKISVGGYKNWIAAGSINNKPVKNLLKNLFFQFYYFIKLYLLWKLTLFCNSIEGFVSPSNATLRFVCIGYSNSTMKNWSSSTKRTIIEKSLKNWYFVWSGFLCSNFIKVKPVRNKTRELYFSITFIKWQKLLLCWF